MIDWSTVAEVVDMLAYAFGLVVVCGAIGLAFAAYGGRDDR